MTDQAMPGIDPERIEADYLLETPVDVGDALEAMAGEQSSGTFVPLPAETPELKFRVAARVERFEIVEETGIPSLPGAMRPNNGYRIAKATLSWPLENIGPSLPNLVATVAGGLFELKQLSGLRILDLRIPLEFASAYAGPGFAVEGTRRLAGVQNRPLIGTIIKPNVGLTPSETAELAESMFDAGIDFIKDDELQSDGPACPFDERARLVLDKLKQHSERFGRKPMYAINITGDLDQMRRRHDLVEKLGGTCVMVSLNSVGLVGLIEFRKHCRLPIHAHRNGWGYLSRHPLLGWSFAAWQKLWRIVGVDHLHVNGLGNKFSESDQSVIESAKGCLRPIFATKPCTVMPVFSSGQTAKQVPATYEALGSVDLIFTAGGGIHGHPDGPAAGVQLIRRAWEKAVSG
ncbi:MAG: ribulose-bisphosphate carboxylase large subunit family protein [Albidovulum sp.]|nr:ribulose-bisphosphate carboxylase large subunit family protein [Albidovulum sp.]